MRINIAERMAEDYVLLPPADQRKRLGPACAACVRRKADYPTSLARAGVVSTCSETERLCSAVVKIPPLWGGDFQDMGAIRLVWGGVQERGSAEDKPCSSQSKAFARVSTFSNGW